MIAIVSVIVCAGGVSIGARTAKKDILIPGAEPAAEKAGIAFKTEMDKVSYVIGTQIGHNFKNRGIEANVKLVARGIEDALSGKEPAISMAEGQKIMAEFQRKTQAKMQEKRLKDSMKKAGEGSAWKLKLQKPALMTFDSNKDYFWILETSKGIIRIKLMPGVAPMHVTSTIFLTKKGFYDGLTFHRIIPGFMAQAGCPLGTGSGGPGYKYSSEIKPNVKHNKPYLLSMANAGPGTDGSQFFLTFKATPWLDGKHTIFGEIVSGQDVMKKLEAAGSPNGKPKERLLITKARIEEKNK
ncbi:MAG: hypothetical protein FVQ85_12465 [Planctomycetes bacterium]|nr:hypothetical protein [Planctomycetota bacterium]